MLTSQLARLSTRNIGQRGPAPGAEIENTVSAGVPERLAPALDVGVQGVGDEWPVSPRKLECRRGAYRRVGVAFFIGKKSALVGMVPCIFPCDGRDEAIGED